MRREFHEYLPTDAARRESAPRPPSRSSASRTSGCRVRPRPRPLHARRRGRRDTDAFSTLHPSVTLPSDESSAAPTWNQEYRRVGSIHRGKGTLAEQRHRAVVVHGWPSSRSSSAILGRDQLREERGSTPARRFAEPVANRCTRDSRTSTADLFSTGFTKLTGARRQWNAFTGMIGRRRRRISSRGRRMMKSRSSSRKKLLQVRQRGIEFPQSSIEPRHVISVCPECLVRRICKVREQEPIDSGWTTAPPPPMPSALFAVWVEAIAPTANRSSTLLTPARSIPAAASASSSVCPAARSRNHAGSSCADTHPAVHRNRRAMTRETSFGGTSIARAVLARGRISKRNRPRARRPEKRNRPTCRIQRPVRCCSSPNRSSTASPR